MECSNRGEIVLDTPSEQTPAAEREAELRLQLTPRLQMTTRHGASLLPKSRKARALLVLIALSDSRTVPRQQAAGLLWTSVERADALARLRDTLHNLQKELREADADVLLLRDASIAFRDGAVLVRDDGAPAAGAAGSQFLSELDGLDPAFDQWLIRLRQDRQQRRHAEPGHEEDEPPATRTLASRGPSVVVTAFDTLGPRSEEAYGRALGEEVATALARLRWFSVITRGRDGRRLSSGSEDLSKFADYALLGNLQADKTQYRLAVKLMDLSSCAIVWAAAFVEEKSAGFGVQDRFAERVAACMDTELLVIEAARHRSATPPRRGEAYSLVLQAIPAIHRLDRDPFLGAVHALEQAVAVDPELAMAHSWLALWHVFFVGQGWAMNSAQSMTRAGRAADRAMMLDPKDARGVTVAGHVKAFLSRRLDEATALHELALQLNPSMALAWHFAGVTHAYSGRLTDAHRCISHARDLAPGDPHGFFAEGALGIVRLLQKDHESAAAIGRRVTERHPQFSSAFKSYLSALGHLGQREEAAVVLQRLRVLEPRFSLQRFRATAPYQRAEDLEHYTAGLRLAGLT